MSTGCHRPTRPPGRGPGLPAGDDPPKAGPIVRFAEHLRNGGEARRWTGGFPGVHVYDRGRVTDDLLARADQAICAFNRTRVGLNRSVRRFLDRPDGNSPEPGDRVMCLRNDRGSGLFNGMQGVIRKIDRRDRMMLFAPTHGEEVWVNDHPDSWNADRPPTRPPGRGRASPLTSRGP